MKILFFIGKGGVGKSTLSALSGLYLAEKSKNVLITSLDPAHNISDIFELHPAAKIRKVKSNLSVLEVDQQGWIKNYLKERENQFSKAYAYLTSFSLEKHFSVLQYAPGIEEYALLQAFDHTLKSNPEYDVFIFDMPPTALSLKFFALADISLLWLKKLFELRAEIAHKNEIISKIRFGRIEMERDRVMQNIQQQMNFWEKLAHIFKDSNQTFPVLVTNPDKLSVLEGERIKTKLNELTMPDPIMAVNKTTEQTLPAADALCLPVFENLTGMVNLSAAMRNIDFTVLDLYF